MSRGYRCAVAIGPPCELCCDYFMKATLTQRTAESRGRSSNFVLAQNVYEFFPHADGVFGWITVISLAAASGDEAVAFIKCVSRAVGCAQLQENTDDVGPLELVKRGNEKGRGRALASKILVNRDIEDFGFIGGLASSQEADYPSACFTDQQEAGR